MMKSFRNLAFSGLLTLGAFSAMTFSSCNSDKCKDVVCQNSGTCNEGTCTCQTGYEGALCQTQVSAKFVGTWAVTETCSGSSSSTYSVTITASGPNKLLINNLGNYGCTVGGTITWDATASGMTFTINDNKCSTQMNATGTMDASGKITVPYTATSVGVTDNCTAVMSK